MKHKNLLKTLLFLLILCAILAQIESRCGLINSTQLARNAPEFYGLPQNSLDAVYIGASQVYCGWMPAVAYEDRGLRVFPLSEGSFSTLLFKYWMLESLKTQPDALIIISLDGFRFGLHKELPYYHNVLDYMRPSVNKLAAIRQITRYLPDMSFTEKLALLFPLIRFHDAWKDMTSSELYAGQDRLMGSLLTPYTRGTQELSVSFDFPKTRKNLDPVNEELLMDLLQTIREKNIQVLFTISPGFPGETQTDRLNQAKYIVTEAGFPCMDLRETADAHGLDPAQDFLDELHVNFRGALKTTRMLEAYLADEYGMPMHSGEDGEDAWEEAARLFAERLDRWTMDFERNGEPHRSDLPAVTHLAASSSDDGRSVRLSWETVPDAAVKADGFALFRRQVDGSMMRIGEVPANGREWIDTEAPFGEKCAYMVVPFTESDGTRIWGRSKMDGIPAFRVITAPKLTELYQDDSGVVLRWEAAGREKDYRVYRREAGGEWELIGETKEHYWTDPSTKAGTEYNYSVSSVLHSGEGYRSAEGLSIRVSDAE